MGMGLKGKGNAKLGKGLVKGEEISSARAEMKGFCEEENWQAITKYIKNLNEILSNRASQKKKKE